LDAVQGRFKILEGQLAPLAFFGSVYRSGCNYIKNHENMKGFGLTLAIFVISGFESGYRSAAARQLGFSDRL
jgi:hypothetical protein